MRKQLRTILASALLAVSSICTIQDRAFGQGIPSITKVMSGEIIVIVPDTTTRATVDQLATSAGCEVISMLAYTPGGYLLGVKTRRPGVVEVPDTKLTQAVATLRLTPGVSADPNFIHEKRGFAPQKKTVGFTKTRATEPPGPEFIPNDPLFLTKQQWHMRMIRMPEAWALQFGDGTPVKIAVIDSGVDTKHPDFTLPDGSSIIVDSQAFAGTTGANVDSCRRNDGRRHE
jgi:hypothetical protein